MICAAVFYRLFIPCSIITARDFLFLFLFVFEFIGGIIMNIGVVGLGLIGGSIAKSAKKNTNFKVLKKSPFFCVKEQREIPFLHC